jgi:hypothetical protein
VPDNVRRNRAKIGAKLHLKWADGERDAPIDFADPYFDDETYVKNHTTAYALQRISSFMRWLSLCVKSSPKV